MACNGWNKVFEWNGNVYYHNKHTGEMRFSPPQGVPDNQPLKRAFRMQKFDKVKDSRGMGTRAYHLEDDVYLSVSLFEGIKHVHLGKYIKDTNRALLHTTSAAIALDEGVWDELCKNKNFVTELVLHYHASSINGALQTNGPSHPEKFRMLLGKQIYIRIITGDNGDVQVDIRYFENEMQLISGGNGHTIHRWTAVPGEKGISFSLDQWRKLTSIECLYAAEQLKALAQVPLISPAKRQPSTPSSSPPSLSKRRKANLKLKIPTTITDTQKEEEEEENKENHCPDRSETMDTLEL